VCGNKESLEVSTLQHFLLVYVLKYSYLSLNLYTWIYIWWFSGAYGNRCWSFLFGYCCCYRTSAHYGHISSLLFCLLRSPPIVGFLVENSSRSRFWHLFLLFVVVPFYYYYHLNVCLSIFAPVVYTLGRYNLRLFFLSIVFLFKVNPICVPSLRILKCNEIGVITSVFMK